MMFFNRASLGVSCPLKDRKEALEKTFPPNMADATEVPADTLVVTRPLVPKLKNAFVPAVTLTLTLSGTSEEARGGSLLKPTLPEGSMTIREILSVLS